MKTQTSTFRCRLNLSLALVAILALSACSGEEATTSQSSPPGEETELGATTPDSAQAEPRLGDGAQEATASQTSPPTEEAELGATTSDSGLAQPRMEAGVQIVDVTVGAGSFDPLQISLKAGTPARLLFTRTSDQTCATQIKLPALGIGLVDLPLNESVAVEFTPTVTGDFTFVCGMDMDAVSLVVQA